MGDSYLKRNVATIGSFNSEVITSVEGQQLGERDLMEPGEDHHVSLVRLSLPVQFDLEGLDVGYRELPDLEGGAEDGTLKSTAS